MRSRALAVQAAMLLILAAGCAKTPATTAASAPSPTGTALTVPTGRSMDGSGGVRPASATGTSGMRERVDQYRATADLVDVHFEFDKYDIRPEAAKMLDANAAWLKANPRQLVLIEGHCDERGTVEYNLALGERRAKATQNYLAAHGVAASRVTIVSYGKERPQCTESNEACWAQNRRAHFLVKNQ
jgi:peptidoglycan-associated lipoprotein